MTNKPKTKHAIRINKENTELWKRVKRYGIDKGLGINDTVLSILDKGLISEGY